MPIVFSFVSGFDSSFIMFLNQEDVIILYSTIYFLIALFSTTYLIPIVNKIGHNFNILDLPNHRKVHKEVLVRIGGVGMFFGFSVTLFFLFAYTQINNSLKIDLSLFSGLIVGLTLFFVLGLLDDIYQLSPILKLLFQLIFASILFSNGLRIENLNFSSSDYLIHPIYLNYTFSFLVTVLWIVGITNALNWLDGLDGLASGVSFISLIGIFLVALNTEQFLYAFCCAGLCGSCIGLLRFNFYPAKILMGDCGSYFLGSFISIITIACLNNNYSNDLIINYGYNSETFFPISSILFCFLPILDMIFVISLRVFSGQSPFYPDRRHFHHKFIDLGLHQRSLVLIFYSLSALAVSFGLCYYSLFNKIVLICLATIFVILSIIYSINLKSNLDSDYKKN